MCSKHWLIACGVLIVTVAAPALAVDGVIEINQAAVAAGGITPGDAPGFPATLSQRGSYRLTGNLDVTGQPSSENVTAIDVTTNDVTVDLNGFAIIGPVACSGTPTTCMPSSGSGTGVRSTSRNTVVVNGTIRGMGIIGVNVVNNGRVEAVRTLSNGSIGIAVTRGIIRGCAAEINGGAGILTTDSVVTGNQSLKNGGAGINAEKSSISNNTASENGNHGIQGDGSVVLGNVAVSNVGFGLSGSLSTGYSNNIFTANNSNGAQVSVGPHEIPAGSNVCGTSTMCP